MLTQDIQKIYLLKLTKTIKTARKSRHLLIFLISILGAPVFSLMSLEEPENADAEGLKKALENSIGKLELTIDRKEHELGLCSDGARVNLSLFNKVKTEIGDHYVQVWCPSHRLELAIRDAFKLCAFNNTCEKDLTDIYYLFKRATLRWRLFKRQALFMGIPHWKYKRPAGTRWVEHQAANINSHNHNLPILIGFLNQQIASPHNVSMKKMQATLAGHKADICHVDKVIYAGVKQDVLTVIQPLSKVLQNNSLILPALITCCVKTLKTVKKLDELLSNEGPDALRRSKVFPSAVSLINQMSEECENIIPGRQTRNDTLENPGKNKSLFYEDTYLLTGELQSSIQKVHKEIHIIVKNLYKALKVRLDPIVEDPLFQAMAIFLDTESYGLMELDDILENVKIITERFSQLLRANGCQLLLIPSEQEILYEHTTRFLSGKSANKTWPHLFARQTQLGISNIIHVAEISIAMPASNAETERVFSFLWRAFSKDRQSIKNENLENILRLRCDHDFSDAHYEHAIEMFLTENSLEDWMVTITQSRENE